MVIVLRGAGFLSLHHSVGVEFEAYVVVGVGVLEDWPTQFQAEVYQLNKPFKKLRARLNFDILVSYYTYIAHVVHLLIAAWGQHHVSRLCTLLAVFLKMRRSYMHRPIVFLFASEVPASMKLSNWALKLLRSSLKLFLLLLFSSSKG